VRLHTRYLAALVFALGFLAIDSTYAQSTATICKDGTTSTASGRGACSGHGGVSKKATAKTKAVVKKEVKAAKVDAKATNGSTVAVVTCGDGTTSTNTGRGACSHHGGVRAATTNSATTGTVVPAPGTAVAPRAQQATRTPAATRAPATTRVGSGAADDNDPTGAIAQCKDGLYSHARNHRGACGHHGGVATWL
jgi:Protein of unknown function (DUF3761)